MEQFVVYVDDATNHARIHKTDCRWYINRKEEILPDNRWHDGPYTLEEAIDVGHDAGKRDYEFCGHCNCI